MFAYIVVVLVLSGLLTVLLAAVERVLLRGRNAVTATLPQRRPKPRPGRARLRAAHAGQPVRRRHTAGGAPCDRVGGDVRFDVRHPVAGADDTVLVVQNLSDPAYLFDLRVTAQAVFMAFVIGTAVGGGIGLLLGLVARGCGMIFEPLIIMLNGIPKIVLYPVLLPIFSLSGSKVVMGVLFALFPVLINVSTGVQEIPRVYWKLARSVQANPWQTLVHIIFPAIRRPLLTGIRLAVSLAVVGVVLSEFFATRRGSRTRGAAGVQPRRLPVDGRHHHAADHHLVRHLDCLVAVGEANPLTPRHV